jgi:hypothetical protein
MIQSFARLKNGLRSAQIVRTAGESFGHLTNKNINQSANCKIPQMADVPKGFLRYTLKVVMAYKRVK